MIDKNYLSLEYMNMRWPSSEEQRAGKDAMRHACVKCPMGSKDFWLEVFKLMQAMRYKNAF